MRYSDRQKEAITQYHGVDPCDECRMGAACCGCSGKREYEAKYQQAEMLGVLSEAKAYNRAVALTFAVKKFVADYQKSIDSELALLQSKGFPKKLLTEALKRDAKM